MSLYKKIYGYNVFAGLVMLSLSGLALLYWKNQNVIHQLPNTENSTIQEDISETERSGFNSLRVDESIVHKLSVNYPYKDLFPYRSSDALVEYKLEPKTLTVTLIDPQYTIENLRKDLDTYLREHGTSLENLYDAGVKLLLEKSEDTVPTIRRD